MSLLRLNLLVLALTAASGIYAASAQDLDAGKTGAQLFAQDCSGCHRVPQGLVKNTPSFSLSSFLRQHYTTSSKSASEIVAYLNSVGSARVDQSKQKADQRGARSPQGSTDPAVAGRVENPTAPRTPKSQRKQEERPGVAGAPNAPPAADTIPGRKTRRGVTAARTPDAKQTPDAQTPANAHGPIAAPSAAVAVPSTTQTTPPRAETTWTAAAEAKMPPPVEAAEPSGLNPGTPVAGSERRPAAQPAFSSPVP